MLLVNISKHTQHQHNLTFTHRHQQSTGLYPEINVIKEEIEFEVDEVDKEFYGLQCTSENLSFGYVKIFIRSAVFFIPIFLLPFVYKYLTLTIFLFLPQS